jgi:Tol biopolymer transport system component
MSRIRRALCFSWFGPITRGVRSRASAAAFAFVVVALALAVPGGSSSGEPAAIVLTAPSTRYDGWDDPSDVVLTDAQGNLIVDLTVATGGVRGETIDREPAWSPDGTRIVFVRDRSREIYVVDVDGGSVRKLTDGGDRNPAWSPDGRRLAFWRDAGIWVVNSDGSGLHRVGTGAFDPERWAPAWSPDGSMVLYGCEGPVAQIASALCVADPDGRQPPRTLWDKDRVLGASWSPDGRRIAVMGSTGLYTLDATSGETRLLSPITSRFGIGAPAWSPDGRRIAFVGYVLANQLVGRGFADFIDVYTVNSDGGELRRLTGVRSRSLPYESGLSLNPVGGTPEPESMYPLWSPDGARLFFERRTDIGSLSGPTMYTMNTDGTCETAVRGEGFPLTTDAAWPYAPTWRPGLLPRYAPLACVDLALAPGSGEARLGNLQYPQVLVHEQMPYTMSVINDGSLPTKDLRLDLIPSRSARVVRAPNSCLRRGTVVSCRLPDELPPNTQFPISFAVETKSPGRELAFVTVRISGTGSDISTANNTVVMALWIRPRSAGAYPFLPLFGTPADETLFGRSRGDVIDPGAGSDHVFAGAGPDTIFVNDGSRDVVHCGAGNDTVYADHHDVIARDCELVRRHA